MAATMFGYLIRLGLIFLAVWIVRDADVDFVSGTRIDHHRHAPWSPVLGDEVRRAVARPTRTQDDRAVNDDRTMTRTTFAHSTHSRLKRKPRVRTRVPTDQRNPALAGHLPDVQQDRPHRRLRGADRHRAVPARRPARPDGRADRCTQPRRDLDRVHRRGHRDADPRQVGPEVDTRSCSACSSSSSSATSPASSRSSPCRRPRVSPSRCRWRCSSGSSTSAPASSTRASGTSATCCGRPGCRRR